MPTDARINVGLPGHHKTKKLHRRLGPAGPWGLVCLFLWAASSRTDGDLEGMTDEDIELAADWSGEPGALVGALEQVGFLDGPPEARTIHDWAEHNPWAAGADDRAEASRWAALCKRYGRDGAAMRMPDYAGRMRGARGSDADGMREQCAADAPSPIPIPSPIPKAKAPPRPAPVYVDAPDWLDSAAWAEWCFYRKGKKWTDRAQTLSLGKLRDLLDAGQDPAAVIRQSIAAGWTGLFPLKTNGASHETSRRLSAVDRVRQSALAGELADRIAHQSNGSADPVGANGRDLRAPLDDQLRGRRES